MRHEGGPKIPESADLKVSEYLKNLRKSLEFESSTSMVEIAKLAPLLSQEERQDLIAKIQLKLGNKFLYISRKDIKDSSFKGNHSIPIQIGRLEIDTAGQATNLVIDDQRFLADTFDRLQVVPYFSDIKSRFHVSGATKNEKEKIRMDIQKENAAATLQQQKVKEIYELAKNNRSDRESLEVPDDKEVMVVNQGEIGFIDKDDDRRYIETIGAGPCIVVVAYNLENKTLGLTHLDALTILPPAIHQLISQTKAAEVSILGGQPGSEDNLIKLKELLEKNKITVKEWDILNAVKSIIVDKKDGKIYNIMKPKMRQESPIRTSASLMMGTGLEGQRAVKKVK